MNIQVSKNIVVLAGSPRKNGNSEALAAQFKKGAESAGKTVTIFHVAHMQFRGCIGCGYCQKHTGRCVHNDDMTEALAAIENADVLVWASPVYYFSVTGYLKLAIDRLYPLEIGTTKQLAILLTCADETSDTADGALEIYHSAAAYYEWDKAGVVIATGVADIGDINGHEALEQARKLGQEI